MATAVGERIKQARREYAATQRRNVTQAEVAELIGVQALSVTRWESGSREPNLATIRKLARALNANPCFLAFGEEGESGWTEDFGTPAAIRPRTLADKKRVPDEQERAKPRPKRRGA